jgi:long-subunit acyl-CoA synthetase (AMP-forming)
LPPLPNLDRTLRVRAVLQSRLGSQCRLAVVHYGTNAASVVAGTAVHDAVALELASVAVKLVSLCGVPEQPMVCANGPADYEIGAIGKPFPGTLTTIGEAGELLVQCDAFTLQAVQGAVPSAPLVLREEPDRMVHTGIRVQRIPGNRLRPLGHMADLLTLRGGRKVVPYAVESALAALPLVAHAMCHADSHDALVALLALDQPRVEEWARAHGLMMPWQALAAHPRLYEELSRGVQLVNAGCDLVEQVRAFATTEVVFSEASGELRDNGELKRDVIAFRFRHVLEELHHSHRT